MKVYIYVDGFNLYYGAVKGTPYRWLNIAEMCRLLPAYAFTEHGAIMAANLLNRDGGHKM